MSGQHFLGSKISLTSNSDIRYEGVLHNLNTDESTVALKQVRSFGTEGRRGNPDEEIPPSDNVFEFVVFRGSDIKDLKIMEAPAKPAPPPPPPANVPNDPAIMSYSGSGMNPYMMPPYPPMQQHQQYWGAPMYGMRPPMGGAPPGAHQQQHPHPHHPIGMAGDLPNVPRSAMPPREEPLEKPNKDLEPKRPNDTEIITDVTVKELEQDMSNLEIVKEEPVKGEDESRLHQQNRQRRYNNNVPNTGRGGRRHDYNNSNGGHARQAAVEIPKSDFDFESSNAKFKKNEILKQVTKKNGEEEDEESVESQEEDEEVVIPPSDESFYDKEKSFFDNISCESKERSKQEDMGVDRRAKFQEERKLNLETFGEASVDRPRFHSYRGRGGYRGRRNGGFQQRGGGRGGGGRYGVRVNARGNAVPEPMV